jgi:DNA-directed RNA polymerase subunit K/omega
VSVKPIDIEKLGTVSHDVYEAIVVAAKRARQVHTETKIELNQRIEMLNQLTNTTESEDEMDVSANPDQLKVSLEFEKRPKSTETAMQELSEQRLEWRYKVTEETPPAASESDEAE